MTIRTGLPGLMLVGLSVCLAAGTGTDSTLAPPRHPLAELPIDARIRVPVSPDWLAVGFGSVWVANYEPSRISRIDPGQKKTIANIRLGEDPCLGIVVGPDYLWVPTCKDGILNEIDPTTNKVVRRVSVPITDGREGSFAFLDGSWWIPANAPDSLSTSVTRIDTASGRRLATITVGPRTDVVITGFGSIWASSTSTNTVVRISPVRDSIVARIPVGGSPKFMAAGEGAVWVQNQADGSISRIDPRRNREVARIAAHAPTPWGDIATGAGAVWLSVNGIPVTRINPRTNRVTHQFVGGEGADAIRFGEGWLWIADHKDGQVWRVNVGQLQKHK